MIQNILEKNTEQMRELVQLSLRVLHVNSFCNIGDVIHDVIGPLFVAFKG